MLRLCLLLTCLSIAIGCKAQYTSDHVPGFLGLESGTEAPPGLYAANIVWVYPTSTVKDANGNDVNLGLHASLTTTMDILGLTLVTNHKLFGGNFGAAVAIPFIKNRIQLDSLDVKSSFAFSDIEITPVMLGWNLKRADITTGYNLYLPTGSFSPNGSDNSGLGMVGNEVYLGATVYPDQKKMWNAALTFSAEFNSDKANTDIKVGDLGTFEGGMGRTFYKKVSGPIPMITNVGVAGYAQFKMTNDSGSDIPPALLGYKDRVFALGPEVNTYIPKPRLTFLVRYEPEFGARIRTQGQTIIFSVAWVAKSLVKQP